MREPVDAARIRRLLEALGRVAERPVRVYLVGGTTAVLMGWRASTIDVDLVMRPDDDAVLRAIPSLKERLSVNVELASPADFIPLPPGWEDRGTFVGHFGRVDAYHFDLYAQALAKIERGHRQDLLDVREMLGRGLVEPGRLREYFERIEPLLYRFPAIDPPSFRRAVEAATAGGR
jgi:hypothetical protein